MGLAKLHKAGRTNCAVNRDRPCRNAGQHKEQSEKFAMMQHIGAGNLARVSRTSATASRCTKKVAASRPQFAVLGAVTDTEVRMTE